jgi:amidohydrolase
MTITIRPEIAALEGYLIATRRHFHQHPEIGFEVHKTAALVAEKLKRSGIQPVERVGRTGVVGDLHGKFPGPTIALRADMDALPICETTPVDYRSVNEGAMHACGHDGHTAVLLAVAEVLAARTQHLRGAVRFIFQPAEEKDGGAREMIQDGCLDGVNEIYGMHLWNYESFGNVGSAPGPVLATTDSLRITVIGKGGHGALPQGTVDAIVVAAHLVTAVQTIVSRNSDPLQGAVVTIGKLSGGTTHNVIADRVVMEGTIRTFSEAIRMMIKNRLADIARGMQSAFGAEIHLEIEQGYPAVINSESCYENLMAAAKAVVGDGAVKFPPFMGGEDFSFYLEKVPGCFFFVGSSPGGKPPGSIPHHCPDFDIDERALSVGASVLLELVEQLLMGSSWKTPNE